MSSASIIRYCVCVLAGLLLWIAQPVSAQEQNSLSGERICPDGKRAYFGVCPEDEVVKPTLPVPVTKPIPQVSEPAPQEAEPVPPVSKPVPSLPETKPVPPQPKTCDYCPEMVRLPGGEFLMGSDKNTDEKPVHSVKVAAFAIGKFEVTQGQWKAVMGSNPSHFKDCGNDCPVEQVSYDHILDYIARLNRLTGGRYRLPTEAEWEYACRAGGKHEYCGSDNADAVARYESNSGKRTHTVGGKQPNAFGLHDMSGNLREWTRSAYTENGYDGSERLGINDTVFRGVIRGGSWYSKPNSLRSAYRIWYNRGTWNFDLGFRLAQDY